MIVCRSRLNCASSGCVRAISEDRTDLSPDRLTAGLPAGYAPLMKNRLQWVTFKLLSRIATQSVPVLIKAEPGSRKQIVAQTLHEMSHLSSAGFEAVIVTRGEHTELLFKTRPDHPHQLAACFE